MCILWPSLCVYLRRRRGCTAGTLTRRRSGRSITLSKEILPSEAFQYGIKAADGRKSKKALKDKDQKLNNELNQINKIIDRRRKERAPGSDDFPEEAYGSGKKSLRETSD